MAAVLLTATAARAEPLPQMQGRTDLALGKKVIFSPKPNYSLTARGETDATDLTDGKLGKRPDHRLWFESAAVGWTYPGRFNLAVDLGKACDIDEIAIVRKTRKSFAAWVLARSAGVCASVSSADPPTYMKFQPIPSTKSAVQKLSNAVPLSFEVAGVSPVVVEPWVTNASGWLVAKAPDDVRKIVVR